MPPLHHRSPGPVAACLRLASAGEIVVELIGDGVHLDPETVRIVFDLAGADNIALVTDSMAATGLPDGDYDLGPSAVVVREGLARLHLQQCPRRRDVHTAGGRPQDSRGRREPGQRRQSGNTGSRPGFGCGSRDRKPAGRHAGRHGRDFRDPAVSIE
ncbi:UNVERIFIED_ORG: hypothetical protein ABIB52_001837 [Arthrobacter sp. UYCu721]